MVVDHKSGQPIFYCIYDGTVLHVSSVIRQSLDINLQYKIILVSDKGYISPDNITEAIDNNIGFLFNCKVNARGGWVQDAINGIYDRDEVA